MTRTYTMKKRAASQAETRQRIVEAAVELHTTVGPSRTTLSMIAEKAGVQRHTLYAHFPDERSVFMACSGHMHARDPIPTAEPWRALADRHERRAVALRAIYEWYERNETLLSNVMRDVEVHPMVQEIQKTRVIPVVKGWHEVLGAGLTSKQRAMLNVALSFHTWRSLARDSGLKQEAAVAVMIKAIEGAG